jgi:hypothetical protein
MNEEEFTAIDRFVTQKCLVPPIITAQNLCSIYQCPDQQMYRARIQFLYTLNEYAFEETTRDALIDMMHGAILFASDNAFPFPKAIVFLSIYMQVFRITISSPFYLPDQLYKRYEKLLLSNSLDRPPYAAPIFELADVKLINDFFVNTFFRNVKLVINCFCQKPAMEFHAQFPVHVPMPGLPPLAEMELFGSARPEEEVPDEPAGRSKSSRSPRAGKPAPPQPPAERSPQKAAKEAPPATAPEPEPSDERGPDIPTEALRGSLAEMHEKFVAEFVERERQLLGKIKELEIRLLEKPPLKKPPARRK